MAPKNIVVLSKNSFVHVAINEMLNFISFEDLDCDGNIAIIDSGSFTCIEDIVLPVPLCYILILHPTHSKTELLSKIINNFPTSFVPIKARIDYFMAHMNNVLLQVRRRVGCAYWSPPYIANCFTEREEELFRNYIAGANPRILSKSMGLPVKTVQSYYSIVVKKAYKKLDVSGYNYIKLYIGWDSVIERYVSDYEKKKQCIFCPAKRKFRETSIS